MNAYKNTIILLALTFIVIVSVFQGLKSITFKPFLLPHEQKLFDLPIAKLTIVHREPGNIAGLRSPLGLSSASATAFPAIPLSELLQGSRADKGVAMILVKEGRRLAIIDGAVVKEGDSVNKNKIVRIEKDRVLMRTDGKDKWLFLNAEKVHGPEQSPETQHQNTSPSGIAKGKTAVSNQDAK